MAHVQHCLDVIVGLMRCDQQKPSLTLACGMARCVGVMMGRGLQGWGMGGWWPPGAWTPPACRLQIPATLAGLTGATRSVHIQTGCCAVLCCAVLCCAVLCCAVLCCAVLCCAVLCCAVLCYLSMPMVSSDHCSLDSCQKAFVASKRSRAQHQRMLQVSI